MAEFLKSSLSDLTVGDLQGTRCRLQRFSDLKFFAGWIRMLKGDQMTVELKKAAIMQSNERFNVEAALNMATVGMPCELLKWEGSLLQMKVTGDPLITSTSQEARYRADTISVSLAGLEANKLETETADISQNGIGVWTAEPLPRYSRLKLTVRSAAVIVECWGTVRYSRPDPEYKGAYRSGIQVDFDDRLSRAMWLRLVMSAQIPDKAP
jgi:hypothetical protein